MPIQAEFQINAITPSEISQTAISYGAIIQFQLIKWFGVYFNQWIVKDYSGMRATLTLRMWC